MFSSNSRLQLSLAVLIALASTTTQALSAQAETHKHDGKNQSTKSKTAHKSKTARKSRAAYFVPPPPAYAPSILSYIRRGHGSQHAQTHTSTGHELAAEDTTAAEAPKSTYETHIKTYGTATTSQPVVTRRGNNVTYVSHNRG
jgi:hypothetical protein